MRHVRSTMMAACAALAFTAVAAGAQTTQDRTTFVTFSGPVSIPGKTLPAGTYTFRLADSQSDRHIVQILEKDSSTLVATMLAVPAERAELEGDPVVTFKETPSDQPPAVHYWYYAGERAGNELVYPKDQAITIARATGESVMSVDSGSTDIEEMKKAEMSRVTASDAAAAQSSTQTPAAPQSTAPEPTTPQQPVTPEPTTPQSTPAQPATPEPTTPQSATPQSTPPASAAPTSDQDRPVGTSGRTDGELPRTASELPAIALLGLLALGAGLTARVARRRLT